MPLTYLDRTADAETVASILRRDGAVAVKELAAPELVDTVATELRPQLDADGLRSRSIFNGDLTRRCGDPLATAPSVAELADHELVIEVLDEVLVPPGEFWMVASRTNDRTRQFPSTPFYGWQWKKTREQWQDI